MPEVRKSLKIGPEHVLTQAVKLYHHDEGLKNWIDLIQKEVRKKKGNVLFNDALNTFYLRLYSVRHMVKNHSDSDRGNPLPPHGLLFPISSKGYFICTIPQTG